MTERKLFLRVLGAALLFGLVFWLFDSLAHHYYFSRHVSQMMPASPRTLLDTILPKMSSHMFFVRLSFLLTCLLGGGIAAHYINSLRKSETRLRQVVENMPVMMDAFDENDNILVWNRECERVTGYRAEEIIGGPLPLERLYPDAESREKMLDEITRLGADFRDREWTLTCKDGTQKTISWSNIAARVPIPGWDAWAVGLDVTERIQAEQALRKSWANLSALIENTNDSIWSVDREYWLIVGNSTFLRNIRAVRGHAFGPGDSVLSDNFPPDVLGEWRARYDRALRGERFTLETQRCFVNPAHCMEYRFSPIRDADGSVTGVTVQEHDITERKQAEEELKTQRDFARQVMNVMGQGLVVTNKARRFEFVNPAYARMIGCSPEDLIGKTSKDVTPAADYPVLDRGFASRMQGEADSYETRLRRGDGETVSVLNTAAPRWREGQVVGSIVVVTDLTAQKRVEEALRDSEEKYRTVVEHANEGIVIMQDGERKYHNPRWLEMTGYSAVDYSAVPLFERIHPEDVAHIKARYTKIQAGGACEPSAEFRLISRSGEIVWLSTNSSRIHWEGRP